MFFGNTVQDTRRLFFSSWQKYIARQPLTFLEEQIVGVVKLHPEYQSLLMNEAACNATFLPEMGQSNPFLHMGLHLAIREQVATNRPQGITQIYQELEKKHLTISNIEHKMMDCLAETLWLAQKNQQTPDEHIYLENLKKL